MAQFGSCATSEPIRLGEGHMATSILDLLIGPPAVHNSGSKELFLRRRKTAGQTGKKNVHPTVMIRFGPNIKDFDSSSVLIVNSSGPHLPQVL